MPEHDDLFEKSKMTFGEHLEELRSALWKSVVAIFLGFLIGMLFASKFVNVVKDPLEAAVEQHVLDKAEEKYREELRQKQEDGGDVPEDIEKAVQRRIKDRLAPRVVQVEPVELGIESEEELVSITLWQRVEDDSSQVIGTGVTQGFMVWVKAALVLGIVMASPWVFWFAWQFVAAGLYPHEKKYVHVFLPFSLGLFLAGAALAFFGAIPLVLTFLFQFYGYLDIAPFPVISDWMGFILILPLGFGVSFQLPLVMLFLERIGIFTIQNYLSNWKIAVLVIAVLSAILTPADPGSMIMMGVPLIILYFGGIGLCRWMPKQKSSFSSVVEAEGS